MKRISVSNTTLFHVAAQQYGDPGQWWRLAEANGLLDPLVEGMVTLSVPALPRGNVGDGLPPVQDAED